MPVGTLVKSSVTKCVGPFEVGAVLSIVEILSAIAPMPAMPFFGYVYRVTYYVHKNIFSVVISILPIYEWYAISHCLNCCQTLTNSPLPLHVDVKISVVIVKWRGKMVQWTTIPNPIIPFS